MSQLSPFVRFSRAMARALRNEAENSAEQRVVIELLILQADAHEAAATDLEQQIARDLSLVGRIPNRSEAEQQSETRSPEGSDWADKVG